MKKYSEPLMEVLIFDEDEVLIDSGDYSADQLNEFFYGKKKTSTTTTIMIQKVNTK